MSKSKAKDPAEYKLTKKWSIEYAEYRYTPYQLFTDNHSEEWRVIGEGGDYWAHQTAGHFGVKADIE